MNAKETYRYFKMVSNEGNTSAINSYAAIQELKEF